MPELPEVETVRSGLQRLIVGKQIAGVIHDTPKSFPNAEADVQSFMLGAKVVKVARRAKVLLIELSSKYTLLTHLKMTGQLVYQSPENRWGAGHPNDSLLAELPDKTTRVTITFDDGSHLFFNDQRKFGWMKLIPTAEIPNIDFVKKLGPEPLAADFTAADFRARLRRRAGSGIKAVLLDQTVIAGVGNIYADESLWAARIHPLTPVKGISTVKLNRLFKELQAVLRLSIAKGGSTDRNYRDAEGQKGSYLSFAQVFRRDGQPCSRCDTTIIKIRAAGRGTHLCPRCQKEPT